MSEIINLAKGNGDDHVYEAAANIMADKLQTRYSFVISTWQEPIPDTKFPIILISTSDEAHHTPSQISDPRVKYVFKQYHPMSNVRDVNSVMHHNNVYSIPLCHLEGNKNLNIPMQNRKYDWVYMGQFDPYRRVDFKNAVHKLEQHSFAHRCYWYAGWNNGVSKEEYSFCMSNAKIALCPCGSSSLETFRFFEAMMCGCAVIGVPLPNVDFYNEANYYKIKDWNNIEQAVSFLLSDTDRLSEMSDLALQWYQKYCSPEGLAEYMLSKLES